MQTHLHALVVAALAAAVSLSANHEPGSGAVAGAPPAGPVEFRPQVIEAKIPGGYALLAVDINKDGKLDVIGVTQRSSDLAWYENPTWERHVILDGLSQVVNLAAADLDRDGIPELAVQSGFAMQAARSEGLNWILRHQGDPRQPWKARQIDKFATSHHIIWADVDGDGRKELINAPLIGPASLAPTYDQDMASMFWYDQNTFERHVITNQIPGILHRVRAVNWDGDRSEELLTASFAGITLHQSSGRGASMKWESKLLAPGNEEKAPRLGASDVGVGRMNGKRFLASVEPWHGNQIVVYTEERGTWKRHVLFDEMVEGHEVALADFNGDGRDDIVAGDRSAKGTGVHVMYAPADPAEEWHHQVLDAGVMTASGCVAADINNDRRPDVVCIGSSSGNMKWYENAGPRTTRSQ